MNVKNVQIDPQTTEMRPNKILTPLLKRKSAMKPSKLASLLNLSNYKEAEFRKAYFYQEIYLLNVYHFQYEGYRRLLSVKTTVYQIIIFTT